MIRNLLFIFLVIPVCTCGQAGIPTLRELIDSALNKDYTLIDQRLEISLTQLDKQKLNEAYLPRVDLKAQDAFMFTTLRITTPDIEIPQLNIKFQDGRNNFTSISDLATLNLGADMLLYSGGKIPLLKRALLQKEKAQTAMLEKDSQEMINEVVTAYDQLALLKQVRIVLDTSSRRLNENRRTADKALSYGLITKYEHQKIEVAQAQLASRIASYEGKRELVLTRLYLLTNIPKERLSGIVNALAPLHWEDQNSIEDRAEIKALDATLEANKYKIKAEKTWFIPKVQLASSLGYVGLLAGHLSSSKPVIAGGDKLSTSMPNVNILPMYNIGIGAKWDIFDGKEGKREVQKAKIEMEKTANSKRDITEKLELNLAKCKADYTVALTRIHLGRTQQELANNALRQATSEYRTGLIKSTQLIDAEEDYVQAALDYIQAVYDQRRAVISLLKATGHLTPQALQ